MLGAVFIRNAFSPESKQKVYERVSNRVLQSRNPDPKFSCNPVMPRVIFAIPPPKHTFNPETRLDFAFKSRIPIFKFSGAEKPIEDPHITVWQDF